jgi:acyl-CoA reductase-like NAD-dependent aldehyde dehydrogenase
MTTNCTKAHAARASSSTIPLWLDGKEITINQTHDAMSPVTNKELHTTAAATNKHALKAIEAANRALPTWSATKSAVRLDIFLRVAEEFIG